MERMELRNLLWNEYKKMNTKIEISDFINDLTEVMHYINEDYSNRLVEAGLYTKEKTSTRNTITYKYMRQSADAIIENITLSELCREAMKLKTENENLKLKVERAQSEIEKSKLEVEKAKKSSLSSMKKKMQASRDRIVSIAETSALLGDQINSKNDAAVMVDTLNNIIASVGILSDEFSEAGLWDQEENKPNTIPVVLKLVVEPEHLKRTRKTATKKETEEHTETQKVAESAVVTTGVECSVMTATESALENKVENNEQINFSDISNDNQ